jgi:two-component system chemotaxis response regulator CheY
MKILLIDDSSLSRNMLKRSLGDEHSFVEAQDAMQGLEKYFIDKPDLVILDLTMPGMNGLELLSQIIQMDPVARVIIGTADIQEFSRKQAEELGALGFITKPFTEETVKHEVERVMGQESR